MCRRWVKLVLHKRPSYAPHEPGGLWVLCGPIIMVDFGRWSIYLEYYYSRYIPTCYSGTEFSASIHIFPKPNKIRTTVYSYTHNQLTTHPPRLSFLNRNLWLRPPRHAARPSVVPTPPDNLTVRHRPLVVVLSSYHPAPGTCIQCVYDDEHPACK